VKTHWIVLAIVSSVIFLSACSPAKYRGWSDGDRYFNEQSKANQTSSKKSAKQKTDGYCGSPYIVRSGDTLSVIAAKCGVDMLALADENHLFPPYLLFVKQELVMPNTASKVYKPKAANTQKADASKNKADSTAPKPATKKPNPKAVATKPVVTTPSSSQSKPAKIDMKQAFIWPTKAEFDYQFIRDGAGMNSLNIFTGIGEAVYAIAEGEVVYAGDGIDHYGKLIILKHPTEHLTVYAHNNSLLVEEGQSIKKGDLIATSGQSGQVSRPMLYVEARYRGRKMDIKKLLKQPK